MSYGRSSDSGLLSTVTILALIASVLYGGIYAYTGITFGQDVKGHLKRAADANSVTLAASELKIALDGIDQRGYCPEAKKATKPEELPQDCYTSMLYNTPDEDVAFWMYNLRGSYTDLMALPADADGMTKSNALIKLRETLLDQGEKGTVITAPKGVARYPHNWLFGLLGLLSIGTFCLCLIVIKLRN